MNQQPLDYRTDYKTYSIPDSFIVPLIEKHVCRVLEKYKIVNANKRYLLDIGCGGQPFRQTMEKLGYEYYSADIKQNKQNTIDVIADLNKQLPDALLQKAPFDFILCTEVVEHVSDWDTAFKNLNILLKKEGMILITCPFMYPLHEEPYDYWRPTIHGVKYYSEKNGFRIMEERKAGDGWDVLGTWLAFSHVYSKNETLPSKIMATIIRYCINCIVKLIKKGILQEKLNFSDKCYLSNIVLVEKK